MAVGDSIEGMKYDISPDESVAQAVVMSVSEFENTAFSDLPPIYETIDPDALNTIFTDEEATIHLSFSYSNSHIVVCNGESLTVEDT
ncbi:HalOD1 output domain-containing protein [Halobellus ordinarius]|uniref:HalOD1 output domain-containing protein n=1 Tax=Halobellus ordinarius TaxID=3075120 RepID=UPI00288081EE|nr:HalOD1 output domain-containing protein [Halobellus sp. ZY16]